MNTSHSNSSYPPALPLLSIYLLAGLFTLFASVTLANETDVESLQNAAVQVSDSIEESDEKENDTHVNWKRAISNDKVETLWSSWQDSDDRETLMALRTDNGKNAFMIACKTGHVALFEAMLAAGADPDASTLTGGTPIMFAALGNHAGIVERLLAEGADPDRQGTNGWSAVTIAAAKGYAQMISQLAAAGVDINAPDVYRWTPLMRAVDNGHTQVVDVLLSREGVNVQQQDEAGNTALHYAVAHHNTAVAAALLEAGANPDVPNLKDLTPRQMALDSSVPSSLAALFKS